LQSLSFGFKMSSFVTSRRLYFVYLSVINPVALGAN